MADVDVKWVGERRFEARDHSGNSVVTGTGDGAFKAGELILAALAGCTGVDLVGILEKKRQKIVSVEAHVTKHNAPEPPWCIEKIEIEWVVCGHKVSEKAVRDAVHLAETKYCSVAASLNSEIVTTIRVVETDGPAS